MRIISWKKEHNIIAGTSLRCPEEKEYGNLALHTGGDLDAIISNRKVLSEFIGIDFNRWVFQKQTHSDHITKVTTQDIGKGLLAYASAIDDSDALYTKNKNVAIGVFHADCVPVLLYDPIIGIICAIHSGWQGTVKEITKKAIAMLIEKEQCSPENIEAYIGPAISFSSFEVGEEVVEQVKSMSFDTREFIMYAANGKAFVDCKGLNEKMLLNAGVLEENITIDKNDTFGHNEALFSYRRDHQCGRHLSFIMMK